MVCPNCHFMMRDSDAQCPICEWKRLSLPAPDQHVSLFIDAASNEPAGLSYSADGHLIGCRARNSDDARFCIEELGVKKKALHVIEEAIAAEIAAIRGGGRRGQVSTRVSKVPVARHGSLLRRASDMVRGSTRRRQAKAGEAVHVLEKRLKTVEQTVLAIDAAVVQLERFIL
jgi:hypothetical protein